MKRAILILTALALTFLLAISCAAAGINNEEITDTGAEISESDELTSYIRDTVAPIIIGVLTSVSALVATLKSIMKTLSGLKDTREQLEKEASERKSDSKRTMALLAGGTEELAKRIENIPDSSEAIEELKKEIDNLICDVRLLSDIVSIGLSASAEAVRSGKGREIMNKLGMIKARESGENEKA